MAEYRKQEARDWAWANMKGAAGVVIPTFTQDLTALNEKAIRYDIRKDIEYGFWGTLTVSETATTFEEYIRFVEWSVDESHGRLKIIHHASFNTLEENLKAVRAFESAGGDLVLLSYPPNFYPETDDEIFQYTKAVCDATSLGVILFPVPLWGFERVHPAGMSPALIQRIVDEIPNIVAIKAEGGMPTIAGFTHTYKMVGDRVIVMMPIEADALPMATLLPMQFIGTSNYQYYGPMIPRALQLIHEGQWERAMELYWQIHPARMAAGAQMGALGGANFVHRMMWKYQGWLSGYNGGPLRMPAMRLVDRQMRALRQGLVAAGLETTPDRDKDFYMGRNPA